MNSRINEMESGPPAAEVAGFDLFRLSRSKRIVDISPNTLRGYFNAGLRCYRRGRAVFVSKNELEVFIKAK
jgi:hypothetical protein